MFTKIINLHSVIVETGFGSSTSGLSNKWPAMCFYGLGPGQKKKERKPFI